MLMEHGSRKPTVTEPPFPTSAGKVFLSARTVLPPSIDVSHSVLGNIIEMQERT